MSDSETTAFPKELVGTLKTVGDLGPPYQVIGPALTRNGKSYARIVLVESDEETDYPLDALHDDPMAK